MDGLRKVPDNVPNKDLLAGHLGKPLTQIPDPFGTHPSFGAHNNARLRAFLDCVRLRVRIRVVDRILSRQAASTRRCVACWSAIDEVVAAVLPTLGPERRATYSPVLPIHPQTGRVMQVRIERVDAEAGTVAWRDPDSGETFETPVTGGRAKLQWKADWAMRWYALGVDYEMSGKDLIDSVKLSTRICRILGGDAAGAADLRAVPRRARPEDQQVQGQRPLGRGLAALRAAGKRWRSSCTTRRSAPSASISTSIPRAVDEYLANLEKLRVAAR